ncbi:hypothetical protein [Parapedobacter soli]|uniref:hypothetical protein n=1 Tax=Parapedobacter soli TaxID=416955 RepID=UPI0021C93EF1|nr:hypothetical protein [Parapedobacter soli]
MHKKRQLNINRGSFKVVAAGFPCMRFIDYEAAKDCYDGFRGPGGCILIGYVAGKTKYLEYKFLKG